MMKQDTLNTIKIGDKLTLSEDAVATANIYGMARHSNNRKEGVALLINCGRNGNAEYITPETMQNYDCLGARSEFAFAEATMMDEESWGIIKAIGVQSASKGMDDGDGYLYKNGYKLSVDVKSTRGFRSNMLITQNKLFNESTADIFVLLIEDEAAQGKFTFAGAIDRKTLEHDAKNGSYPVKSATTWWVHKSKLYQLEDAVDAAIHSIQDIYIDNLMDQQKGN
jgi:hypothetical protein